MLDLENKEGIDILSRHRVLRAVVPHISGRRSMLARQSDDPFLVIATERVGDLSMANVGILIISFSDFDALSTLGVVGACEISGKAVDSRQRTLGAATG